MWRPFDHNLGFCFWELGIIEFGFEFEFELDFELDFELRFELIIKTQVYN